MSALTLTLKPEVDEAIDVSALTPTALADVTQAEIRAMRLDMAGRRIRVGDVFLVSGRGGDTLRFADARGLLDGVAAKLDAGTIELEGGAGDGAAAEMRAGQLHITGGCGDYLAASMTGGEVFVRGTAGDHLGGALPGRTTGMRGGVVVVTGRAGDLVANRMRRGTLVVTGDVGAFCASRMVAGTVIVGGRVGPELGYNARRGTIAVSDKDFDVPSHFRPCGELDSVFVELMKQHVKPYSPRAAKLVSRASATTLYRGDIACGGLGELLVFATS